MFNSLDIMKRTKKNPWKILRPLQEAYMDYDEGRPSKAKKKPCEIIYVKVNNNFLSML